MVSGGWVWEPQRDEIEGVGEMVGEGGVVGCLRGSSVVGEISLCSLRSPSPHKRLQLQLQWHSLQTTPPYASRRLPRELTVTRDGPARPNPDMDWRSAECVKVLSRVLGPLIKHITNVEENVVLQDEGLGG